MQLSASDPDIATIYRKIKQGRLDLQPNFQRGEVWSKQKKQRLIDSILRGWHIPPIHVVQVPGKEKQEVLDGQQRLAAIRDFLNGCFPINGKQDPLEDRLVELDGLHWETLPLSIQASIEDFTIRILTVSNYKPGEPGELFYRLNQPTNLTSAEQRNAFFGEARQQVKILSERMSEIGFSTELIGFSNARMAYDDVLSRCLLTLEQETLSKKITANAVTARYRESVGFRQDLVDSLESSLEILFHAVSQAGFRVRLNKATLYSWLIFIVRATEIVSFEPDILEKFISYFESLKIQANQELDLKLIPKGLTRDFVAKLIKIFLDRASSRVSDISSVKLRDIILWSFLVTHFQELGDKSESVQALSSRLHYLSARSNKVANVESLIIEIVEDLSWGNSLWRA